MNYVYVLRSLKNNKRYVGSTRASPENRLKQHNHGCNKWSRENKPFELLHFEEYETFREARQRENHLKTTIGRRALGKLFGLRQVAQFPPKFSKESGGAASAVG